jgi:hypothetical protein
LNKYLQQLAKEYPHVKFGRMLADEASEEFSDVVLPIILIYKSGDVVSNNVRITDLLGTNFDIDNVRKLLKQ